MNEVKVSQSLANAVTGSASSTVSGGRRTEVAEAGKTLPPQKDSTADIKDASAAVDGEAIDQAVTVLNNFVQNEQRDLLFSVDDGSGDMVVKVVDRHSGELVRQIPSQVVLDLAEKARLNEPLQLINMHG